MTERAKLKRGNVPMTTAQRNKRIIVLIRAGKTNREIAEALQVTRGNIDRLIRTRHLREAAQAEEA